MLPSPLRAVLFDLDGVLIDSYEVWFHVMNDVAGRLGYASLSRAEFHASWGQGIEQDVARFYTRHDVASLERAYDESFPRHLGHLKVDPEVGAVFAGLHRRGLATAVVTNTPAPLAQELLRRAGADPGALVGGTDVERAKPAPDMVLLASQRLGAPPEACVVVGDSRYDEEAARAAGAGFVGMKREGDLRIERLGELLEHLGSPGGPRLDSNGQA